MQQLGVCCFDFRAPPEAYPVGYVPKILQGCNHMLGPDRASATAGCACMLNAC